jgi:lauroyl/myristoyl acyltransferase
MTDAAFDATDVYLLAVLGLLRTVEWFGSARLRNETASATGTVAYWLSRRRRQRSAAGLQACDPGHTAGEIEEIVRGTFQTFWHDTFYMCRLEGNGGPPGTLQGAEHLREAACRGRGAILLENSFFGFRNVARRLIWANGWRPHQTHSTEHLGGFQTHGETWLRSRVVRPSFERREKQFVESIIYMPGTSSLAFGRDLARHLQANRLLYISGEGPMGHRHIERAFLGRLRPFATGVFNLARLTGAPILPVFCHGCPGAEFSCVIDPPLNVADTPEGPALGIAQYARRLEDYARRHPEQYRNWDA